MRHTPQFLLCCNSILSDDFDHNINLRQLLGDCGFLKGIPDEKLIFSECFQQIHINNNNDFEIPKCGDIIHKLQIKCESNNDIGHITEISITLNSGFDTYIEILKITDVYDYVRDDVIIDLSNVLQPIPFVALLSHDLMCHIKYSANINIKMYGWLIFLDTYARRYMASDAYRTNDDIKRLLVNCSESIDVDLNNSIELYDGPEIYCKNSEEVLLNKKSHLLAGLKVSANNLLQCVDIYFNDNLYKYDVLGDYDDVCVVPLCSGKVGTVVIDLGRIDVTSVIAHTDVTSDVIIIPIFAKHSNMTYYNFLNV